MKGAHQFCPFSSVQTKSLEYLRTSRYLQRCRRGGRRIQFAATGGDILTSGEHRAVHHCILGSWEWHIQ